jgi:hypothetical protein
MDMASRGRIRGGEKRNRVGVGVGVGDGGKSAARDGERNEVAKVGKVSSARRQAAATRKKE